MNTKCMNAPKKKLLHYFHHNGRHKFSVLTAKVSSRNLFRSIGFSRAAPDLIDSQICHGLWGQEGRKRAEEQQENMRTTARICDSSSYF